MFKKYGLNILFLLLILVFGISYQAKAQTSAGGIITRASSQMIFWYDEDDFTVNDRNTYLQITNTSDTTPVEIHIQIYASSGDGTSVDSTVRCLDNNFNDVLTPNDTHVYDLEDIRLNMGESNSVAPVPDVDDTKGFVVITPVVGGGDNTAISFQHLIGNSIVQDDTLGDLYQVASAGRDAVDLLTGGVLAQGTPLDGITTGYLLIQPDEVVFNFADSNGIDSADVIAITFADEYGPAGLLGYRAVPGDAVFSPFLFNFEEVPASCPQATNTCFNNWGLTSDFPAWNTMIDPGINICDAVDLPDDNSNSEVISWARIFVSGLSEVENHLTLIAITDDFTEGGADWSNVVGPPIPIDGPQPCQNLPAECGNPECKGLEGCENAEAAGQEDFCADGIDNDDINGTDCEDFGCDGSIGDSATGAICQLGAETDCEDGFDNDANGFTDCGDGTLETADPECVALEAPGCPPPPNGDTGDDSGGCVVAAGPVATGTAAANFLLPLLPLAGAYALRRIRRRSSK